MNSVFSWGGIRGIGAEASPEGGSAHFFAGETLRACPARQLRQGEQATIEAVMAPDRIPGCAANATVDFVKGAVP